MHCYSTSPERRRAALTLLALPACYSARFPRTSALLAALDVGWEATEDESGLRITPATGGSR